jgi:galactonate dehydratase
MIDSPAGQKGHPMTMGTGVTFGSRRSFLRSAFRGTAGGLLASGISSSPRRAHAGDATSDSLRIAKVEPHVLTGVRAYGPWVLVRVETADGFVGWGEGTNFPGVQPIATAVRNLADVVVGASAWEIERLWNRMYRALYYNGMGGVVMAAISAIDIALYDIVGQKLGVPVYNLLGGKVRDTLQIYANGWTEGIPRTPESLARRTKELVEKGYTGCKFDPFTTSPLNREVTPQELRAAVAQVEAVRAAGGPDYEIAIDVHGRWNTNSALKIIRALEPCRLLFLEEAVPPENVATMAEVQRSVNVPLATGERIFGRHGFRELLERQAVRIIQPDIARTGGITEFKKIASMAETYYVSVAPHNPNGPICTVASIHACLSIPNFLILEFFERDEPVFQEIIDGGLRRDKAAVFPPAGAGLGVRISDEFLRKHRFDEARAREMERRTFDRSR